jgi:hypothetical protein
MALAQIFAAVETPYSHGGSFSLLSRFLESCTCHEVQNMTSMSNDSQPGAALDHDDPINTARSL